MIARLVLRLLRTRMSLARRLEAIGFDETLARLDRTPPRAAPLAEVRVAIRIGEAIARRVLPEHDTCLYRALSRYALVRAAGHDAVFVLGVARDPNEPGHAWVELDGVPWMERSTPEHMLEALRHPPPGAAREV